MRQNKKRGSALLFCISSHPSAVASLHMASLTSYLFVLVILFAAVLAQDNVLVNSTEGGAPTIVRTFKGAPPVPAFNQNWYTFYAIFDAHDNYLRPPFYWGNTFTITGISLQNDTLGVPAKRLNPFHHFAIENQTIAMEGQEYLIRPRAFINVDQNSPADKRWAAENPWNAREPASSPFTITPQYASFRVANSSGESAVAFFEDDLFASKASFEVWASNPSAMPWVSPGSTWFNVSDDSTWDEFWAPAGTVQIEWLVACRWIENGTDCAPAPTDYCALVEYDLCWARTFAPSFVTIDDETGVTSYVEGNNDDFARDGSWSVWVAMRPLILLDPTNEQWTYSDILDFDYDTLVVDVPTNVPTRAFTVSLPLNDRQADPTSEAQIEIVPSGFSSNQWLQRFMPGKDGTGGVLEISVRAVVAHNSNTHYSAEVDYVLMDPPMLRISRDQPVASFRFLGANSAPNITHYHLFFRVNEVDSDPSTVAQANDTTLLGDVGGQWPQGAYLLPDMVLFPVAVEVQLENFPFNAANDAGIISVPITLSSQINCAAPGPGTVVTISHSPASLGVDWIRLPFNVTPGNALEFWTCPTASTDGKRQLLPSQIDHLLGFEFSGNMSVLVFYTSTMATPYYGVGFQFFTPVTSNEAVLAPDAISLPQNSSFTFDIVRNNVQVEVTAGSLSSNLIGGPYTNDSFYISFTWTPPTYNGFMITISGQFTVFDGVNTTNNGTTANYAVGRDMTGFLAGPMRVPVTPTNIRENNEISFENIYSIGFTALGDNSVEHLMYQLPNPVVFVTVQRHRFTMVNQPATDYSANVGDVQAIRVVATGQRTEPICIGPAFVGAIGLDTTAWVSLGSVYGHLIYEAVVHTPGVQPPNAVVLTAAAPIGCFTARFDTNYQGVAGAEQLSERPITIIAGPGGSQYTENVQITEMPVFELYFPKVTVEFQRWAIYDDDGQDYPGYAAGETVFVFVSVELSPPTSFSYNLSLAGATFTPVSADAGTFTADGPLQHLWSVTFFVTAVSEMSSDDHSYAFAQRAWRSKMSVVLHGSDAILYRYPLTQELVVYAREISSNLNYELTLPIGLPVFAGRFTLRHPVLQGIRVVPRMRSYGASAGPGVAFIPPQFDFVPGGVNTIEFQVVGLQLGEHEWSFTIQGPDWPHFEFDLTPSPGVSHQTVNVVQRPAPQLAGWLSPDLVAGITNILGVHFPFPALAGEEVTLTLSPDTEVVLSQDTFDGHIVDTALTAEFVPVTFVSIDGRNVGMRMSLSGADAWKYEALTPIDSALAKPQGFRFIAPDYDNGLIIGVRYTAVIQLEYERSPTSQVDVTVGHEGFMFYLPGATTGAPFIAITFGANGDGAWEKPIEFVCVRADYAAYNIDGDNDELLSYTLIPVQTTRPPNLAYVSNGNGQFSVISREIRINGRDFNQDGVLNNVDSDSTRPQLFMANRPSAIYTMYLTSPPETALTVTLSHPNIQFNDGDANVVCAFGPGQQTSTFSFTPIGPYATVASEWNFALAGADAPFYQTAALRAALQNMQVVPELGFSPIPSMYTDETVTGLHVWLVGSFENGFQYDQFTEFTLHIEPEFLDNVIIEPSVLHFTRQSIASNRLSQTFSVKHQYASKGSAFNTRSSYALKWRLKFAGQQFDESFDTFVPADAQQVLLKRYQVLQSFPDVLNFGWQSASINISRAPHASISLTPNPPLLDGDITLGKYGGSHVAGGLIVFDPAVVIFSPGQQVAHFRMKAIPGSDQSAVYYRVQWRMAGRPEDLTNYIDYVAPRTDYGESHFSSWHIAAGGALTASVAAVCMLALALLSL